MPHIIHPTLIPLKKIPVVSYERLSREKRRRHQEDTPGMYFREESVVGIPPISSLLKKIHLDAGTNNAEAASAILLTEEK